MCQLHDVDLNQYITELTDSFKRQRHGNAITKEAAHCQGLNGRKTRMLNESVQVDQHGNQAPSFFAWGNTRPGTILFRESMVHRSPLL